MAEHKKQHYVPQSYLRRFSTDEKRLFVFDKVLRKSFPSGIRDVAQEAHFYRVPAGLTSKEGSSVAIDPLLVEKWFQGIEGQFDQSIRALIELTPEDRISPETRIELSLMIAIQFMRTRANRNLLIDATEQLMDTVFKHVTRLNFGEEAVKYSPTFKYSDKAAGLFQSQQILDSEQLTEMGQILHDHVWNVLVNETDHPFYTSDTPVVMHAHIKGRGVGFASPGIEVALPLSSTRLLRLTDRQIFDGNDDRYDNCVRRVSDENVEYYNSLQVIQSERQVYCEKDRFALAEDMLNENPKLGDTDRSRVSVR
jgi:hypothetical protein